jgi:septum formation protein
VRAEEVYELPLQIARAKAKAIIAKYGLDNIEQLPLLLITADQVVVCNDNLREKPASEAEAKEFLHSYSNSSASTVSAVVVTHLPSGVQQGAVDTATVYFNDITAEAINAIVQKGAVFGSAGGFLIEDDDFQPLIKGIDGEFSSVLGMPVPLTVQLMTEVLAEVGRLEGQWQGSVR